MFQEVKGAALSFYSEAKAYFSRHWIGALILIVFVSSCYVFDATYNRLVGFIVLISGFLVARMAFQYHAKNPVFQTKRRGQSSSVQSYMILQVFTNDLDTQERAMDVHYFNHQAKQIETHAIDMSGDLASQIPVVFDKTYRYTHHFLLEDNQYHYIAGYENPIFIQ